MQNRPETFCNCNPAAFCSSRGKANFLHIPIGDGVRKVWRFRLSELTSAMLHSRQRSHVPEEI